MAFRIVRNDPLARARPPVEFLAQGWSGSGYTPLSVDERIPEDIRLNIAVDSTKLLVLADAWSPGWRVVVDGQSRRLHRVGGYFKGVVVQPGDAEVRFMYQPDGWLWGKRLCGVGVIWWLLWFIYVRFGEDLFGKRFRLPKHQSVV